MGEKRLFTKKIKTPEIEEPRRSNKRLFIFSLLFWVLVLVGISYIIFGITTKWSELLFTWNKTEMVRSVKTQYNNKFSAMEKQFISGTVVDDAKLQQTVQRLVEEELKSYLK